MQERTRLSDKIEQVQSIEDKLHEHVELIELGEEEGDDEIITESEEAILKLKKKADQMQLQSLLSGEVDSHDAFLEVHAGSGGSLDFWSRVMGKKPVSNQLPTG
jgi:peptide chain release factor 2